MSVGCGTVAVKLQPCQLTLYSRNIPNAVFVAPPEDEQVMLETFRDPWFSINWKKSASRWFYYTDILWFTVKKTLRNYLWHNSMYLRCILFKDALQGCTYHTYDQSRSKSKFLFNYLCNCIIRLTQLKKIHYPVQSYMFRLQEVIIRPFLEHKT
jgi:hypothetical protein